MPPRSLRTVFSHDVGVFRELRQVHRVERDAGGLRALVVAGDAVGIEQRARRQRRR